MFPYYSIYIIGPICRSENDTCGFQSTSPSRYHGFCCEGYVCTYYNAGGAGKCEIGKKCILKVDRFFAILEYNHLISFTFLYGVIF